MHTWRVSFKHLY